MEKDKEMSYFQQKYPKSKKNIQCIGPCYPPNKKILHPVTIRYESDYHEPFCPTLQYTDKKSGSTQWTDVCYHVTAKEEDKEMVTMNIINPSLAFTSTHFLRVYYNITSFEDALQWLDNNSEAPYYTQERIINCAWNSYGDTVKEITTLLIMFYLKLSKKRWMRIILASLNKYLDIKDEEIKFGKVNSNKLTPDTYLKVEKINFLIERLINFHTMQQYLIKYVQDKGDKWDQYENYTIQIRKGYTSFLETIIKDTIKHQ